MTQTFNKCDEIRGDHFVPWRVTHLVINSQNVVGDYKAVGLTTIEGDHVLYKN